MAIRPEIQSILQQDAEPDSSVGISTQNIRPGIMEIIESTGKDISGFKERRAENIEKAADIGFPLTGAALGASVGGPVGAVFGATIGKGVQEVVERGIGKKKDIFPDSTMSFIKDDTVIGNMVKEGLGTYLGTKIFKIAGPTLSKAKSKVAEKIPSRIKGKKFAAVGDYFETIINELPERQKDRIIRDLSLSGKRYGIKPSVTERVMKRGPKSVLTESNLSKDSIDRNTISKVSNTFEDLLDGLGKKFDKRITPLLQKNKALLDVDDLVRGYSDDISELFSVNNKGKLVAKSPVDDNIARIYNKFSDDIVRLRKNPTPQELHKFKQLINKVMKNKAIRENPNAIRPLTNFHKSIRNKLENSVIGYKKITDEFRDVFELEEQIGRRLSPDRVETLLKDYFNPDKEFLRSQLDELFSKSKLAKKTFDSALDERAAKYFIDPIKKDQNFVGGRIMGVPLNVGLGGKSAQDFGKELINKETMGMITPLQRGVRGAISQQIGERADVFGEKRNLIKRKVDR